MSTGLSTTAGIDTSKAKLDVAIYGRPERWQVDNRAAGWRRLADELCKAGITRVGIEASGGYERGVVAELRRKSFTVLVLQPIQVRAYARVHLRRAKNDALDAVLIAACAATIEPPASAPDERPAQLADQLTYIEQVEEDIARLKTRLEHVGDPRLRRMIVADIARYKARRSAELLRIVTQLRRQADLARRLDLVLSVPGIGERTALALIIRMPELGRVSREQAAALAGLAPYDDDTGTHRGQRHIAGGRSRLRRALFAAAPPAAFHWNRALIETLWPSHGAREGPQCGPRRLRQKAPHLRQYRRRARNAVDAGSPARMRQSSSTTRRLDRLNSNGSGVGLASRAASPPRSGRDP